MLTLRNIIGHSCGINPQPMLVNIGKGSVFKEMERDTNEGWPISPAKGTGVSRFSPKNGSLLLINSFATFF